MIKQRRIISTMKIYIDAGHGGNDTGAVWGTRREAPDNLRLAQAVQARLDHIGFETMMSRTGNYNKTVKVRTDEANAWGAEFFLSLHRNWWSDSTANGYETFIQPNDNKGSKRFQEAIHKRMVAAGVQRDRGQKTQNFHVTRESKMPAILVETGFVSNTQDNLLYDRNFDKYADAAVQGIIDVLGTPAKPPPPSPGDVLYRVVAGSFRIKENADNMVKELQKLGYSAFIVEFKP
jgi:N-acetylmuramoyl-L-alanine amidase